MLPNRSCPRSTVIPELPYADVRAAAAWLCATFGFTVRLTIAHHRVQINVGDGAVVATELRDQPTHCSLMVRVEDAESHYAHAKQQGARILQAPETYPYGERQYVAEDLGGHRWCFTQTVADVDPADWGGEPGEL